MVKMKPHPTLGIMVRSDGMVLLPSKPGHPEHWTKGCKDGRGYYKVGFNYKDYAVHRLVAETFIPNPEGLPQVDHIRSDEKWNNDESNLRWVTARQNLYNRSNSNPVGLRKCDMTDEEYNRLYNRCNRKTMKKIKETK